MADDFASNTTTTGRVDIGGTTSGNVESYGDTDWFAVQLTVGRTYQFSVAGSQSGGGTLQYPYMMLYNSTGAFAAGVTSGGGVLGDPKISFSPKTSGTYYVSAYSLLNGTGTYKVSAQDTGAAPPPPTLSVMLDPYKVEGNSGVTLYTLGVTRSGDTSDISKVTYTVTGSGAKPASASDFVGGRFPTGTISFASTSTMEIAFIGIAGDTAYETDETFTVTLSDPVNGIIGTASIVGTIRNDDTIDATRRLSITSGGSSRELQMDVYSGPVAGLKNVYLGDDTGEAMIGSTEADFLNTLGGDDAANGGDGGDVLDGGSGSNFLTGGSGKDTFFVDGRGGGVTWSTVTDLEKGEWATIWGFKEGTSKIEWKDMQGAEGYQGATAFCDFDGNGTIDASMTFTGFAASQLMNSTGTIGGNPYLAIALN